MLCKLSGNENTCTSGFLNSLDSSLSEELCSNNNWNLWENSFTEYLEVSGFGNINHRDLVFVLCSGVSCGFSNERPKFISVDSWLEIMIVLLVEHSHTKLSVVSWMVFVHHDSLVMHTTSFTSS